MNNTRRGPRASSFKLPDDLLKKVNVLASARGAANTDIVIAAIANYLDSSEVQEEIRAALTSLVN